MSNVSAAKYRQRITIMQPVDTRNTSAGYARTWANVSGLISIPAQFVYAPPAKKGDEVYQQQQVSSGVFATVTIRYYPSINVTAVMRVIFGIRTFEIRTVLVPDEYPQEITLQVEEIRGQGSLH
jgi:head-tail adaptor